MTKSGWDWAFIEYAGRVWFLMKPEEIWKCTPRKFYALLDVRNSIEGGTYGQEAQTTSLDQVKGW